VTYVSFLLLSVAVYCSVLNFVVLCCSGSPQVVRGMWLTFFWVVADVAFFLMMRFFLKPLFCGSRAIVDQIVHFERLCCSVI